MSIEINIALSNRQLFLKNGEQTLGTYPVAIGKPSTPTPTGNFKVVKKILNPGGVLGTRWIQFTWREHGIHGTNQPWLIGRAVSHGCVRMYNRDVEKVYPNVKIGTPVIIRPSFSKNKHIGPKNGSTTTSNYTIYTVKKGDSLWKIANQYHISISTIKSLNNLTSNIIYPGQKLKLPSP